MFGPHSSRARSTAEGSTTIFTGSKRAMALATRAKSTCTSARVTPQPLSHRAWLWGKAIQVAACSTHSAGMTQPFCASLNCIQVPSVKFYLSLKTATAVMACMLGL
ncbi:hypothetical protein D3C72_2201930 [compost metagenome]